MRRSELERRLARDAGRLEYEVPSRVRGAVLRELSTEEPRRRFAWAWPTAGLAMTAALAAAMVWTPAPVVTPAAAPTPTPTPAIAEAESPGFDRIVAAREAALAEEYDNIQRDIARLRSLLERA